MGKSPAENDAWISETELALEEGFRDRVGTGGRLQRPRGHWRKASETEGHDQDRTPHSSRSGSATPMSQRVMTTRLEVPNGQRSDEPSCRLVSSAALQPVCVCIDIFIDMNVYMCVDICTDTCTCM